MGGGVELEIGDLLDQIVAKLRRDMGRHAAEMGMTRFDWAVLRHLYYDSIAGRPSTADALMERLEMSRGQMSDVLDGLIERGYVRIGHACWELTHEADRVIVPLVTLSESIMTKATSGLTADQLDQLVHLLGRVSDNIGAPRSHVDLP